MDGGAASLINPAPVVHERRAAPRVLPPPSDGEADAGREPIDAAEVFGHLRDISDPEHPYTLEQARWRRGEMRDAACTPAHIHLA